MYLVNILVYSKGTLKEYIKYIKKILRKLKEYKLYLQLGKYQFFKKEIEFLGYIILTKGIKINLKKV